jgi:NAD(P)-dependent dehydrogenase (short-subunit alcohol dehydrogenase family)
MKIEGSVVLVTGANRGIGLALTNALVAAGASKVYAAARDPKSVKQPGVVPLRLDVTNAEQAMAAAREAGDVSIVINNAGIASTTKVLSADADAQLRKELETNVFGLLNVSRAFAPVLAKRGGGALVNVLSVVSWISSPLLATYAASKSAAWSVTNALRNELRAQHTQVVGAHFGFVDTDLTAGIDQPKLAPELVAKTILAGVDAGREEIVVDDFTRAVKAGLSLEHGLYLAPRG